MRVVCRNCKQPLFVHHDPIPDKVIMTCKCGQKIKVKVWQREPNPIRKWRENEAVRMRESGMTWAAIGTHFGKSDTWAIQVIKRIRPKLLKQAVYEAIGK